MTVNAVVVESQENKIDIGLYTGQDSHSAGRKNNTLLV